MQRLTIGIFDSGVGGLAVYREVRARLPGARFVYCFDNLHFPYGSLSEDEVVLHTLAAVQSLVVRHQVNLLIIACNTASTIVLPQLRTLLAIPVIGVVPAIKPAAALTKTGTIGLLATHATVARRYSDELIAQYASGCQVVRVGSSALVELAERKLRGAPLDLTKVRAEIAPLFAAGPGPQQLDCVVLGCTHFPLLAEELVQAAPWPVQWLDSGTAIAGRSVQLAHKYEFAEHDEPPLAQAYCTRLDATAQALEPALRVFGIMSLSEL